METTSKALDGKSHDARSGNRRKDQQGDEKQRDDYQAQNTYSGAGDLPAGGLGSDDDKVDDGSGTTSREG